MDLPVPKPRLSMGKVTAFLQMVSIGIILIWIWGINIAEPCEFMLSDFMTRWLLFIGIGGLWLSLAASVWSAVEYTVTFAKKITQIKK